MYEPKHTVELDRQSKLVRFYVWLWGASEYDIDLCKIFWGMIFFPVALVGHFVIKFFIEPIDYLHSKYRERHPKKRRDPWTPPLPKIEQEEKEPGRLMKVLNKIGAGMSWFFGKLDSFFFKHGDIVIPIFVGLMLTACGVVLITVAVLHAEIFFMVIGVVTTLALLVLLLGWLVDKGYLQKSVKPVFGFFKLMGRAAVSAKNNTCPRVVVVNNATSRSSDGPRTNTGVGGPV